MTLAQLKSAIDEISRNESPDTQVDIFLWSGRAIVIGSVKTAAYTDGSRAILIHEK